MTEQTALDANMNDFPLLASNTGYAAQIIFCESYFFLAFVLGLCYVCDVLIAHLNRLNNGAVHLAAPLLRHVH